MEDFKYQETSYKENWLQHQAANPHWWFVESGWVEDARKEFSAQVKKMHRESKGRDREYAKVLLKHWTKQCSKIADGTVPRDAWVPYKYQIIGNYRCDKMNEQDKSMRGMYIESWAGHWLHKQVEKWKERCKDDPSGNADVI